MGDWLRIKVAVLTDFIQRKLGVMARVVMLCAMSRRLQFVSTRRL